MATVADAYSRFVFWLKVLLPLAALAILSTLFLVAETLDPNKAIPFAEVDVEKILREQGITRPSFGGVTSGGALVQIAAAAVRPDPDAPDLFRGNQLSAEITLPGGTVIGIQSPEGQIDTTARQAVLDGGARLESTSGYIIETTRLTADFKDLRAETAGTVHATSPGGSIEAGRMVLERNSANDGYLIVFKDGVRLVYDPEP